MNWGAVTKINSDLTTPLNEGGVKIVKSVQRGYINSEYPDMYDDNLLNIMISEIDSSKSIVLVDGGYTGSNVIKSGQPYCWKLSDNELIISTWTNVVDGAKQYTPVGWQIVEFY